MIEEPDYSGFPGIFFRLGQRGKQAAEGRLELIKWCLIGLSDLGRLLRGFNGLNPIASK